MLEIHNWMSIVGNLTGDDAANVGKSDVVLNWGSFGVKQNMINGLCWGIMQFRFLVIMFMIKMLRMLDCVR